jgi:GNAT superfamily N-acetyltransferase
VRPSDTGEVVRLATHADVDELVAMRRDFAFEDREDDEPGGRPAFDVECRAFLADALSTPTWQIWVAELDHVLIGHAFVALVDKVPRPEREHRKIAYLTNVYTRPAYRNRGVGGRLVERAKEAAHEVNVELMIVWPADESGEFYERHGFSRSSEPLIWKAESVGPKGVFR